MEGMERIKDSILSEAKTQAEKIIKEAEDRVKEMKKQAAKSAEEITKTRLQKAETEAKEAAARKLSMEELELKKQILKAKQGFIDQAFEKALSRLKGLPEETFADMIVSVLKDIRVTGEEEIVVSQRDREMFEKGLLKKINDRLGLEIKLSEETRSMQGGFIVKTRGVEINNSFETLLRMERERIETEIADILFQ
jgi:V/A-type H+-transporting ATPase subunit E